MSRMLSPGSLPPDVTRALFTAVRDQVRRGPIADYGFRAGKVLGSHTTEDLLRLAAVRGIGGTDA